MPNYFNFYDTETSGISPAYDQILQFASIKTDSELNIIPGSELNLLCKPRPDVIPHPKAYLTHNIDIKTLINSGMSEFELAIEIQKAFTIDAGSAVAGYNTESFDNEMTRSLLFRNMKDPYLHEWSNNNSKFDVYLMMQMVYALTPELIDFPKNGEGKTSLKLELLSAQNGIIHENAHDALSDVKATISLAKIILDRNPRLFQYAVGLSDKKFVSKLMNMDQPILHFSSLYGMDKNMTTPIMPMAIDSENKNKYINLDLRHDPEFLLSLSDEDIQKFMFTSREELPDGSPEIPIVTFQSNKQPGIVRLSTYDKDQDLMDRSGIDMANVHKNIAVANKFKSELRNKLRSAMSRRYQDDKVDPYKSIYTGGFISKDDATKRASLCASDSVNKFSIEGCDVFKAANQMTDKERQFHLINRAKWNSFYENILQTGEYSKLELQEYALYLGNVFAHGADKSVISYNEFQEEVNKAIMENDITKEQEGMLKDVASHVESMKAYADNLGALSYELRNEAIEELSRSSDKQNIMRFINKSDDLSVTP